MSGSFFHASLNTVSRGKGHSAVAAAAYRHGEKFIDERTGEEHDYSRLKHRVSHSEILLSDDAPEWAKDRAQLWNIAEATEKHPRATVARDFVLALPAEVSHAERVRIAQVMGKWLGRRHGVVPDLALHDPTDDSKNFHAHFQFTTREYDAEGLTKKTRHLDGRMNGGDGHVRDMRRAAALILNLSLSHTGLDYRVTHKSYEDRGLDIVPTKHRGKSASALEEKDVSTGIANDNREIEGDNKRLRRLQAEAKVIDLAIERERRALEKEQAIAQERGKFDRWSGKKEAALSHLHQNQMIDLKEGLERRREIKERELEQVYGDAITRKTAAIADLEQQRDGREWYRKLADRITGADDDQATRLQKLHLQTAELQQIIERGKDDIGLLERDALRQMQRQHAQDTDDLAQRIGTARERREQQNWVEQKHGRWADGDEQLRQLARKSVQVEQEREQRREERQRDFAAQAEPANDRPADQQRQKPPLFQDREPPTPQPQPEKTPLFTEERAQSAPQPEPRSLER